MDVLIQIIKSIIFGIVEGITEWLPISSTGHLILLNSVMPLTDNAEFWKMYEYVIQLGAILAVILLFWNKLWPFSAKNSKEKNQSIWNTWIKIIIASVPTAIIGLALNDLAEQYLDRTTVVAAALIIYGILFIILESVHRKATVRSVAEIKPVTALCIGLAQSLAIIPGTSRSGSTILGSIILGLNRSTATEFSFFLAIPVMFGITLLKLIKHAAAISGTEFLVLAVGMIVSFLVSVVSIRGLLKYVRKHDFKAFGYYRIVLGILILVLVFANVLPTVVVE